MYGRGGRVWAAHQGQKALAYDLARTRRIRASCAEGVDQRGRFRVQRRGMADARTDEELMLAYARGEARAFEVLLSRYQRGLFNFVLRSVRTREAAEEVVQDAFLRIIRGRTDYSPQAKFSTWLFTIARNLCIDAARRGKHRNHASLDAPAHAGSEAPLVASVPLAQIPADRHADSAALRPALQRAIDGLPDDQREVFVLRELSDLSFKEIADVVGVSENTVKSRMRYALEKLRVELAAFV